MNCATCRYLEPVIDHNNGEPAEPVTICRRYPPLEGTWPIVHGDDWCGEYVREIGAGHE